MKCRSGILEAAALTEYPEAGRAAAAAPTPDSDSDSTGSLEMRPARRGATGTTSPLVKAPSRISAPVLRAGTGRGPPVPRRRRAAHGSDDERPFATDDEPADAKDWDDQPAAAAAARGTGPSTRKTTTPALGAPRGGRPPRRP